MVKRKDNIDILESVLRKKGNLLDILLTDRTTKKSIIWATDSYESHGKEFSSTNRMSPDFVTGKYRLLIQPRASKSLGEQRRRTKERGEVFTPLQVVDKMNSLIENRTPNKGNWKEYVRELRLEIACGEAPFIVSRYDPVAHTRKLLKIKKRVGFLDRKLNIVSKYCNKEKDWLAWAKEAFKASYGYEWQGDNVLLARENLLYTLIDYYQNKFGEPPTVKVQEEFAVIISWNIFQMDGLKYVVPMSCGTRYQKTLFDQEKVECLGCSLNNPSLHNGIFVKVMNWQTGKIIDFVSLQYA